MTPGQAIAWLESAQGRGIRPGLEAIRRVALELGVPGADGTPLPAESPRIFHVAGTNGKGSVCAFLDAALRAGGLRVGLYTSPHLVRFEERIVVGGKPIAPERLAEGVAAVRETVGRLGVAPTYFELATAVALRHFAGEQLDAWVLETGMGGRLDATNLFASDVALIAPVDLDHRQWLGETLAEIAAEKAGILKPGRLAFSSPQREEARRVLAERARALGVPLRFVQTPYAGSPVGLEGSFQRWNAALATAAIRAVYPGMAESALSAGIAGARWPGRFQQADEGTVLDGAHNPAAAAGLAETWIERMGARRATVVLAVLADKDAGGIAAALAPVAARFVATAVASERCRPPEELAGAIRAAAGAVPVEVAPGLEEALRRARPHGDPVLVTGSLYLVGEYLARCG